MRHPLRSSSSVLHAIALAVLLILASACSSPGGPEIPADEFPPDPDLPPAVVELPAPPPASAFEIREFNDDGTLRVEGLISNRDRYLEETVRVRGVITEIEGDCDPAKAKKRGEPCPKPHLFIRDHSDDDRRIMVVGYPPKFLADAKLKTGQDYLFTGSYKQMADGFVSTEDGLITLSAVDDKEVSAR